MTERKGLLEWAIRGLKHELRELEDALAGAGRSVERTVEAGAAAIMPGKPKRRVSAAARAKMAAAQKARWAKRKASGPVSKHTARKSKRGRSTKKAEPIIQSRLI
jgi:hypothetical protein